MADILKGLFNLGAKPSPAPVQPGDGDFADYAAAPSPEASASPVAGTNPAQQTFGASVPISARPYTKWYNVHERVTVADFYAEMIILPLIALMFFVHLWGTRKNKTKARTWVSQHVDTLRNEFAVVGFGRKQSSAQDSVDDLVQERTKDAYVTYATGRQNVAFVDVKIGLMKRYNPFNLAAEYSLGFFFDAAPITDRVDIEVYPFDGRENDIVPRVPGSAEIEVKGKSTYEGFVWAIVHKDRMRYLRDQRYDLSLTITKENPKLPDWASVMSESAEITDQLLTNDLVNAIKDFGEDFEALIITDQPVDAPKKLDNLIPKKRLQLSARLGSTASAQASNTLLSALIRLPDTLATLKFRPEVTRRIKATREEESKKIRKLDEQEKADERRTLADKTKKDERDRRLKSMSAEEQKKFLEKERERDQRKSVGKRSMKA